VVGTAPYTHTFWVKNTGNTSLHISHVTFTDAGTGFQLTSDECTGEGSVAPSGRCAIAISFDGPTDDNQGASIHVTSDSINHQPAFLDYDMTGVRFRTLHATNATVSAPRFQPKSLDGTRHGTWYSFKLNHHAHVTVQVVNQAGKVVRSWRYTDVTTSGTIGWRGKNQTGGFVPPGIYHFRLHLSRFGTQVYSGRAKIRVAPPS
jgi:hypothetical protein